MTRQGDVSFKFSAKIKPVNFKTAFKKLSKQQNRRLDEEYQQEQDFEDTTSDQLQKELELAALTQLMKLTNSITTILVPGQEFNSDKKTFTWSLTKYDADEISIRFNFTNPDEISSQNIDTMKVTFYNTDIFLQPADTALSPIAPGFQQILKLPPQGLLLMTEQEVKDTKQSG